MMVAVKIKNKVNTLKYKKVIVIQSCQNKKFIVKFIFKLLNTKEEKLALYR